MNPKLQLKNAGKDTNVFATEANAISDTIVTLSPIVELTPAGRRLRLSATGSLDFNHFVTQASERSTDYLGVSHLEWDFAGLTFLGGGGRSRIRERFAFEEQERVRRNERHVNAGVVLRPKSRLSGSAIGTLRSYDFGGGSLLADEIRETLARTSLSGRFEARYAITRSAIFVTSWDTFEDRFANQIGQAPRHVRSSRYLAGFETRERAVVRGRVLGGLRQFPRGTGAPSYTGFALAANASASVLGRARMTVLADRDILFGTQRAGTPEDQVRNSYVWNRLRGETLVELPLDLVGRGYLSRESASFLLPFRVGTALVDRTDRLWIVGGSILRRFSAGISAGFNVDWERRSSNFSGASYGRLRYGLQAEFVP